jgi:hypothetical protein
MQHTNSIRVERKYRLWAALPFGKALHKSFPQRNTSSHFRAVNSQINKIENIDKEGTMCAVLDTVT